MLRDKVRYPFKFYYFAIITNTILRFTWLLEIFEWFKWKEPWDWRAQWLIAGLAFLEMYRTFQWALLRVENESVNNFEKYRVNLEIPVLPEEDRIYKLQL